MASNGETMKFDGGGSRYYHIRDHNDVWVEVFESEMYWTWCACAVVTTSDGKFVASGYVPKKANGKRIDKDTADKAVAKAMKNLHEKIEDFNHSVWLNKSNNR
jgi:hypothetical protein